MLWKPAKWLKSPLCSNNPADKTFDSKQNPYRRLLSQIRWCTMQRTYSLWFVLIVVFLRTSYFAYNNRRLPNIHCWKQSQRLQCCQKHCFWWFCQQLQLTKFSTFLFSGLFHMSTLPTFQIPIVHKAVQSRSYLQSGLSPRSVYLCAESNQLNKTSYLRNLTIFHSVFELPVSPPHESFLS